MQITSASMEFQVTSDKNQLTDADLEDMFRRVLDFVEREGYTITDRNGEKGLCSRPRMFVHKNT